MVGDRPRRDIGIFTDIFIRGLAVALLINISWSETEPMMGYSRILGPNPYQICATTGFDEEMAVADVDIEAEILKAKLYSMGGSDLLKDRKPATYNELAKPNKFNPISGDLGQGGE
jgi:hypothetical protein